MKEERKCRRKSKKEEENEAAKEKKYRHRDLMASKAMKISEMAKNRWRESVKSEANENEKNMKEAATWRNGERRRRKRNGEERNIEIK